MKTYSSLYRYSIPIDKIKFILSYLVGVHYSELVSTKRGFTVL